MGLAAVFALFAGAAGASEPCTPALSFERSPEPLARYSGAVWLSWEGGGTFGSVMSEDDGARIERGFRNRWRYTITGAAAVGLVKGCALRTVAVRAIAGGMVAVSIDRLSLLILPGDPDAQDRFSMVAPVCEVNRQLVSVEEVEGRWRITIEDPAWLPWSRGRC